MDLGRVLRRIGGGLVDVCDGWPDEPAKSSLGSCGRGVSPIDSNPDTTPDCNDPGPGEEDRVDDNGNGTRGCLQHGPTPTVSGCGFTVLALALLAVGSICFYGRQLQWATRVRIKLYDRRTVGHAPA